MAITDFDYIATPCSKNVSREWSFRHYSYPQGHRRTFHEVQYSGTNGEPYLESDNPDKWVRSYKQTLKQVTWQYNSSSPEELILEKSFVKKEKLQQIGILDSSGNLNPNKMISIRMKLKLTEHKKSQEKDDYSSVATTDTEYYRYFAGINLFGQKGYNILDYQEDDGGIRYDHRNFPINPSNPSYQDDYHEVVPSYPGFPSYTTAARYMCTGYNLLLSSDGRGARDFPYRSFDYSISSTGLSQWPNVYPENRHLSLYAYGDHTPVVGYKASWESDLVRQNQIMCADTNNWKLYQCNELASEAEYGLNKYYSIRLDYIPISDYSHKLVSYARKDGDLEWTKVGEIIHNYREEKYLKGTEIGFVIGTFMGGTNIGGTITPYYDPIDKAQLYGDLGILSTNTFVESFDIYTEDINS